MLISSATARSSIRMFVSPCIVLPPPHRSFDLHSLVQLCFHTLFVLYSFILFLRLCRSFFVLCTIFTPPVWTVSQYLNFNSLINATNRQYVELNSTRSPRLSWSHRSQILIPRTTYPHAQACQRCHWYHFEPGCYPKWIFQ